MPLVTRELSITYGSTVVGAGTNYIIDGKFSLEKAPDHAAVGFDVIAWDTTEAAFATTCSTLETAYRTPRQKLVIKFNSTTHVTFDPSNVGGTANTGFDQVPAITKSGSPHDTGRSRRYSISVRVNLPADTYSQSGRQNSSVNLTFTEAGRRRLFISGTYTALTTNDARAQFNASIDAYASSLTTAFGGTWEGPLDQQEIANDTNKTLTFSRAYEELIYNESSGVLADPALRRQSLVVSRTTEAPGDTIIGSVFGQALRLQTISLTYSVAVVKAVTQDLVGTYQNKVRPWLIQVAASTGQQSSVIIISESPTYDFPQNRISVAMTLLAAGSGILLASARTDDAFDNGKDLVGIWATDRMTKLEFDGPQTLRRTITVVTRTTESSSGFAFGPITSAVFGTPAPSSSPAGNTLKTVFLGRVQAETPMRLGRLGSLQLDVIDRTTVDRYEYIVSASGGGSGATVGKGASAGGTGGLAPVAKSGGGGAPVPSGNVNFYGSDPTSTTQSFPGLGDQQVGDPSLGAF